jgi:hypothetical protein
MIMFFWDFGPYYSQHFIFALYSADAKPSNQAMETGYAWWQVF